MITLCLTWSSDARTLAKPWLSNDEPSFASHHVSCKVTGRRVTWVVLRSSAEQLRHTAPQPRSGDGIIHDDPGVYCSLVSLLPYLHIPSLSPFFFLLFGYLQISLYTLLSLWQRGLWLHSSQRHHPRRPSSPLRKCGEDACSSGQRYVLSTHVLRACYSCTDTHMHRTRRPLD